MAWLFLAATPAALPLAGGERQLILDESPSSSRVSIAIPGLCLFTGCSLFNVLAPQKKISSDAEAQGRPDPLETIDCRNAFAVTLDSRPFPIFAKSLIILLR